VCDVLDGLGVRTSFLGADIGPLWPGDVVAGTATTLRCRSADDVAGEPYGVLFRALAAHQADSVLVIAAGDRHSGVWGELLSVAAMARGVVGVVTDGLVRDRAAIGDLRFPVHAGGVSPLDSAGRQDFAELNVPVTFGDVEVHPHDWILADELGAVAIPARHVDQVIELAETKSSGERAVRRELEAGDDLGAVFRRHGIL
jgi:4-hydroxy-4-methyl-2-oxoglutarate aldolase